MTEALRLLLSAIRAPRDVKFTLHNGDCLDVLRTMPENSVDSIVTDPPYGLSFMGKKWDYDVPSEAIWRECLRVLKPGGHLLAFAGTRTQHRMAVRIEDAGFEIRDMIAWVYSTGFPKSHNLDRSRGEVICGCDEENIPGKPSPECEMRSMRNANVPTPVDIGEGRREVLQPGVPQSRASATGRAEFAAAKIRLEQPGMEGRSDVPKEARQLRAGEVRQVPVGIAADGAERWLRDGTPTGDGAVGTPPACPPRVRPSSGSRPAEQQQGQSRTVALQSQPQNGGAWPHCARCGKPRVLRGLGTALKPALEPITVARKPLAGTVAENVLQWGCGGLNIDGCRVEAEKATGWGGASSFRNTHAASAYGGMPEGDARSVEGRWPANLIHDGSDDVLAGFPEGNSRFFYCAKASKKDRDEGLDGFAERQLRTTYDKRVRDSNGGDSGYARRNQHPTVKPTDLMRYLARLVTPPGGVVLDPFMGSGSTGKAAMLEGFRFIGIERDEQYMGIARARIGGAL